MTESVGFKIGAPNVIYNVKCATADSSHKGVLRTKMIVFVSQEASGLMTIYLPEFFPDRKVGISNPNAFDVDFSDLPTSS